VTSRLASDSATATLALLRPTSTIATGVEQDPGETISPSTSASVRNAAPSTALRIAGSTTRSSAVAIPAPRLRAASTSVRSGIAASPLSTAR
jgi:hypothetical protein